MPYLNCCWILKTIMQRKKQVHSALPKLLLNSEDNHEKKQVHSAWPKLLLNSEDNHEKKQVHNALPKLLLRVCQQPLTL